MTVYFNSDKQLFARMHRDELVRALSDPRLPASFLLQLTENYPGLAIVSDDEGYWYLGYIDLTDGDIVLHDARGVDDGKNPHTNPVMATFRVTTPNRDD